MGLLCFFESMIPGRSSHRAHSNTRCKRKCHVKKQIVVEQSEPHLRTGSLQEKFLTVPTPAPPTPPHIKSAVPSSDHAQDASRQPGCKPSGPGTITTLRLMAALPKRPQVPAICRKPLPADSSVPSPSGCMTTKQIFDVIKELNDKLNSCKFKVSGKAAWAVWGYDLHAISHVTIYVPVYAGDTFRTWAKIAGMHVYNDHPLWLGVPLPDGCIQQVKMKWVEEKSLEYLGTGGANAVGYPGPMSQKEVDELTQSKVLSLPSLLDRAAMAWRGDSSGPAVLSPEKQQMVARDIFWVLHRMLQSDFLDRGWPVLTRHVPAVCDDAFWSIFHVSYPHAKGLFAQIGLTEDKILQFQRSKAVQRNKAARTVGRQLPRRQPQEDFALLGASVHGEEAGRARNPDVQRGETDQDPTRDRQQP